MSLLDYSRTQVVDMKSTNNEVYCISVPGLAHDGTDVNKLFDLKDVRSISKLQAHVGRDFQLNDSPESKKSPEERRRLFVIT